MHMGGSTEFDRFQLTRNFDSLDGIRALSILLVITAHMGDSVWNPVHGAHGVTVFFVISGFLITTLLLREESRKGRISIRNFYIRRIFRLLPLYYTALLLYSGVILGLGFRDDQGAFVAKLPYYLTYMNEFGPSAIFGHTWSLGVEEKFYLLWPLLIFGALASARRRMALTILLAVVTAGTQFFASVSFISLYTPILLGCMFALLMNNPRTFQTATLLRGGLPTVTLLVGCGIAETIETSSHHHLSFSILVALTLPSIVIGPAWLATTLGSRWLRYIGTRSYAIYLFHPLCIKAVGEVIAPSSNVIIDIFRLISAVTVSLAVSEIMFRLVERPCRELGRRIGNKFSSDPVVTPTSKQRSLEHSEPYIPAHSRMQVKHPL